MLYHIYTTDGIILKRSPFGEANVLLYVLTKDLGLVMASAQSARLSKSKLRHGLQEYSHVLASFVKGKNGWKLTNVSEKGSFFFDLPRPYTRVLAQIVFILIKMMPGEHPHPEIFKSCVSGMGGQNLWSCFRCRQRTLDRVRHFYHGYPFSSKRLNPCQRIKIISPCR